MGHMVDIFLALGESSALISREAREVCKPFKSE